MNLRNYSKKGKLGEAKTMVEYIGKNPELSENTKKDIGKIKGEIKNKLQIFENVLEILSSSGDHPDKDELITVGLKSVNEMVSLLNELY